MDGCTGHLSTLGTCLPDLTGPYAPVAPVAEGPVTGAPAARGAQAHRVEPAPRDLAGGSGAAETDL